MEAQNETPVAQPFFFDLNVKEGGQASLEYQANAVLGRLNETWFSLSPYLPNAAMVACARGRSCAGIAWYW